MPRPIFTHSERTEFTAGTYNDRHTELEMRTDLVKVLKSPASGAQLEQARGQLAPFLRDTLVGVELRLLRTPGGLRLSTTIPFWFDPTTSRERQSWVWKRSLWQTPRVVRSGISGGRWRSSRRIAGGLALCPGEDGGGLHFSGKRAGSDLVRPGAGRV